MRDTHIRAIEQKIYRIKTYKRIGKMLLVTVILVAGINLVSNIDDAMTEKEIQKAVLSEEKELDKQSIDQAEKVAEIENQNLVATYGGSLTPQELDIVCRVVAAEARGEDLQGQMAVAQVIRDRAQYWDMSVTEVVTAPSQFAKPYQGEISDEVKLAVANVFDGNMSVLEVPTTHFYSGEHEPYWTSNKVNRGSIGSHSFWY
jgi:spore germination cell wall hydrolase CwlJ-like protein